MGILQESRASHSCNIKAYIGNLDFLWLGSLALLQICRATSGRSLYPPVFLFSLVPVLLLAGDCIVPSVQHQVV